MPMTKKEMINFWIEGSNEDYQTMLNLFLSKDYSWCLFMGHIVIEKLIKALYVKQTADTPPFIHDLLRLFKKTGIEIDNDHMDALDEITTFNIKSRYDDYKKSFRKLCTKQFTEKKVNMIKETRKWLMNMLLE